MRHKSGNHYLVCIAGGGFREGRKHTAVALDTRPDQLPPSCRALRAVYATSKAEARKLYRQGLGSSPNTRLGSYSGHRRRTACTVTRDRSGKLRRSCGGRKGRRR